MKKERVAALDIVRSLAIFFVITLHSVSLTGVLSGNINSIGWTVNLYIRHLTFCCVPLFIILSGYLQCKKKLSLSYYKGIIPIAVSYIIISILSLIAKAVYDKPIVLTPTYIIAKILDFTANDYAWYFEMYIGLFLLIPFLNAMYNALSSRAGKLTLISTLSFLTLLPLTVKSFSPAYAPGESFVLDIIPDFFTSLYPITYYFIGAYFAEYRPFHNPKQPKRAARLAAALLAPAIPALLCYAFSHIRGEYAWYMMNGFNTLTAALTAVAVFTFLYDFEPSARQVKAVFKFISECTFEIYLFSFIFDSFYYAYFACHQAVMILLVFISSLAAAFITRLILIKPLSALLVRLYSRLLQKLDSKRSNFVQTESAK